MACALAPMTYIPGGVANSCSSSLPSDATGGYKPHCMVARADNIEGGLKAPDSATCLHALREVRNQVIGNKQKKSQYLRAGVLQQIIDLLDTNSNSEVLVQCAAVVGSLAYEHDDAVRDIASKNGIVILLRCLSHEDAAVVQAAARTLKLIYQSGAAPHDLLLHSSQLQRLVELLSDPNQQLAAVAAAVLERCSYSSTEAKQLCAAGAVPGLLKLLASAEPAAQGHALTTLAALCSSCPASCQQLLDTPGALAALATLTRHPSSPELRLQAVAAVAALVAAAEGGLQVAPPLAQKLQSISRALLPGLIKLLGVPTCRDHVPRLLSTLLRGHPTLLPLLLETDTLKQLLQLLKESSDSSPQLRANCLQTLGSFCLVSNDARRQLVELKAWPLALAALADGDAEVRAGGAVLVHALSRSVAQLRSQGPEVDVAGPLCKMLGDDNGEVQLHASAALCNLVLEFSNVRQSLLRCGALKQLVQLATSMMPEVRLNAAWALKNLVFEAEDAVRGELMAQLTWEGLQALLADEESGVRAQALALLQNLCKGGPHTLQEVLNWSGGKLLTVLQQQLEVPWGAAAVGGAGAAEASTSGGSDSQSADVAQVDGLARYKGALQARLAALYTVANLCAGSDEVKAAVMASQLPRLLVKELQAAAAAATSSSRGGDGGPGSSGGSSSSRAAGGAEPAAAGQGAQAEAMGVDCSCPVGGSQEQQPSAAAAAGVGRSSSSYPQMVFELCVPAIWAILNLLWLEEELVPSAQQQQQQQAAAPGTEQPQQVQGWEQQLRGLGVVAALRALQEAPHQDLRERVAVALEQLEGSQ